MIHCDAVEVVLVLTFLVRITIYPDLTDTETKQNHKYLSADNLMSLRFKRSFDYCCHSNKEQQEETQCIISWFCFKCKWFWNLLCLLPSNNCWPGNEKWNQENWYHGNRIKEWSAQEEMWGENLNRSKSEEKQARRRKKINAAGWTLQQLKSRSQRVHC